MWVAGKIGNALIATAFFLRLSPLAFRPAAEAVACAAELLVLWLFMRRANEDVLLGNLGVAPRDVLAPLAVVHVLLSGILSLAA